VRRSSRRAQTVAGDSLGYLPLLRAAKQSKSDDPPRSISELIAEGINLTGIGRVLALEADNADLGTRNATLQTTNAALQANNTRRQTTDETSPHGRGARRRTG
jgi:hypothetical protein